MEQLDYGTSDVNRAAVRARRRARLRGIPRALFSRRFLVLLLGFIAVGEAGWIAHSWYASNPRNFPPPGPWELRVLDVDGQDIAMAMYLQVHKFDLTIPNGKWDLQFHLTGYAGSSTTPLECNTVNFTLPGGQTYSLLTYLPSDASSQWTTVIGGSSARADQLKMLGQVSGSYSISNPSPGRLRGGVPYILWRKSWNALGAGGRLRNPADDRTVYLTLTASPFGASSPTTSPVGSPPPGVGSEFSPPH
jgi:hypothetical protein